MGLTLNKMDFSDHTERAYRGGNVPLACIGINGLSLANVYIAHIGNDSNCQTYCNKVNDENETGTLYPKHKVTLIPQDSPQSRSKMMRHLNDCFDANEKYIKSENLYFCLRDQGEGYYNFMHSILVLCARSYNFSSTKKLFVD